ncbi:MAG TPA: isovaleryl-CoA dehydrogenase [Planctomycetaceae bacterium]|jgi:putative acyl-CoA dehydrogenase|nr:isovaleryl-CoA dehydrogenase [Planctomycetaceae bacterium]
MTTIDRSLSVADFVEAVSGDNETHRVENQPPALENYNAFTTDIALREAVMREGGGWGFDRLTRFGELVGSARVITWGQQANRFPPILRTHDRFGHRVDEVEFHPAWHELMTIGVEHEAHALAWRSPKNGAHVVRAALEFLLYQQEAGVGCPLTMTFAAVPTLRREAALAAEWLPRITSNVYDPRFIPASEKKGALIGMAMTEKQGGSDVRANTTRARPIGGDGTGGSSNEYLLTGHKWFCSAPMSDAFLTLAQTERGLTCFLVPRWKPDGNRNVFAIQRLKDKLGNRSNASSEIEYRDTWAQRVGEEGRGVATIIEMVNHTRLDCVVGSAALMRQAVVQAVHHASHRRAFGKLLIEQPAMQNVLADLAVESEAATALMARLARAYDRGATDEQEKSFARIATAVGKFWVCKRAPAHIAEALECLGGNGYVEESMLPRLYREAPLNSIWEGSGNVMCLDVLRAIQREPQSLEALRGELESAKGADPHYDRLLERLGRELTATEDIEVRARQIVELLAIALQAAVLLRAGVTAVTDAFLATRVARTGGQIYGTLPTGTACRELIDRARPIQAFGPTHEQGLRTRS